jgi:hypothetical protein
MHGQTRIQIFWIVCGRAMVQVLNTSCLLHEWCLLFAASCAALLPSNKENCWQDTRKSSFQREELNRKFKKSYKIWAKIGLWLQSFFGDCPRKSGTTVLPLKKKTERTNKETCKYAFIHAEQVTSRASFGVFYEYLRGTRSESPSGPRLPSLRVSVVSLSVSRWDQI